MTNERWLRAYASFGDRDELVEVLHKMISDYMRQAGKTSVDFIHTWLDEEASNEID